MAAAEDDHVDELTAAPDLTMPPIGDMYHDQSSEPWESRLHERLYGMRIQCRPCS